MRSLRADVRVKPTHPRCMSMHPVVVRCYCSYCSEVPFHMTSVSLWGLQKPSVNLLAQETEEQ